MKIPRILIISYYFPPANTVNGHRVFSWARNLIKSGIKPVVITRHWTGNENAWKDLHLDIKKAPEISDEGNYIVHRIESRKNLFFNLLQGKSFLSEKALTIYYFIMRLSGRLNMEVDAYLTFKEYLYNHLRTNHYDILLVSSPPLNIIKLASDVSNKFKIPYIVDFRDLWNNEYLRPDYVEKGWSGLRTKIILFWLKKWLKRAASCITVSQGLADQIGRIYEGPIEIVQNGYDSELYGTVEKSRHPYFTILMAGTYYPMQHPEIMAKGLKLFLNDKNENEVCIKILGGSVFPEVIAHFTSNIEEKFLTLSPRVKPSVAVSEVKNADILLHAGWKGYKGIYTTKMFDYIASGNNILLCPGDDNVLDELILETETGKIANSPEEFANIMEVWFGEWKVNGTIKRAGNSNKNKYSREFQTQRLAKILISEFNKDSLTKSLILSYYLPPCNGAASWRAYSWGQYFPDLNLNTTIITRHWSGNEVSWQDLISDIDKPINYIKNEKFEIYSLPGKKNLIAKSYTSGNNGFHLLRKFLYFIMNLTGHLDTEVDAYRTFRKFLKNHLKTNKYDFIILTSPPLNILKLAPLIKKSSIGLLILDFRDLWTNDVLKHEYKPSLNQRVQNFLYTFYVRRWVKYADLITVVSDPFSEILRKYTNREILTIYNGYEDDIMRNTKTLRSDHFRFSLIGTIHPQQDLNILINGLQKFLMDKTPNDVKLNFIGLDAIPETSQFIQKFLPRSFLNITGRVDKSKAIEYTLNSEVLFYPGWKGSKGMISTKAFDYIASGNRVLIAPGDGDVLDELIIKTKSGLIADSVDAFTDILNTWYSEWLENGKTLPKRTINSEIEYYSRKNQAHLLAQRLLSLNSRIIQRN